MFAILRSFLFLLPAETAHHFTMKCLRFLIRIPGVKTLLKHRFCRFSKDEAFTWLGMDIPHRVGLAAGFDKNAEYLDVLAFLGFAFVEIGTLTPKPQAGNPKPRLFRLPQDGALVNRMGFNNQGVDAAAKRLENRPEGLLVGGNIGKNKTTPNEKAEEDYVYCFNALKDVVDYMVINVSSPNTPGLRELQGAEGLTRIIKAVQKENQALPKPLPLLLKISPDLTDEAIEDIATLANILALDGIIATNTTLSRADLQTPTQTIEKIGNGGLSGRPLKERALDAINPLTSHLEPHVSIVSVGGIVDGETAAKRIAAGADVVQVWTGFIYHGPALIKSIRRALMA